MRSHRGRALIVLVAVVLVGSPVAIGLAKLRTDTSPASFLPADDPTIKALPEVARSFGGDPIVVLLTSAQPKELLQGDDIARIVGLEGHLATLPDVAAVYGPGTVLNQIASAARSLMATIAGRRDLLEQTVQQASAAGGGSAQDRQAAQDALADFDVRYGGLLVRALPGGLPTLRNPRFANTVVFGDNGEAKPRFQVVVPRPDSVAILVRPRENLDQTGTERLVTAVRESVDASGLHPQRAIVSGTPAVQAALGGTVRHEMPLLGALSVVLVACCYFLSPWSRRRRRLLPVAATLCATAVTLAAFGWLDHPLSLGVITVLPILIGIGSDFPAYLVQGAPRRRVVVTAFASAAGFAALAASPLPFVRDLGLALSAGVLIAVSFGMLIRRYLDGREDPAMPGPEVTARVAGGRGPGRCTRWAVLVVVALFALGGWVALPRLSIQADPQHLAAGLPAVDDALAIEDALGFSGEVRILVSGANVLTPEALGWMREAQRVVALGYGGDVRPIVTPASLLEFLGPAPTQDQITAGLQMLPHYLASSVIRDDGQQAVLSFGLKLQDLADQARLIDGVRAALPPPPPGIQIKVVGLPVAAAQAYETVSGNRYLTNLLGIVAAGLVLAVGLARRRDAVRAFCAALLATGWGLGFAWLFGISLTPLTVALGSLTVAVACEFTVVLGYAGEGELPQLRRTVGVAALAAAMGYLALAPSDLAVIREFGLLLAGTVVLALAAAHATHRLMPGMSVGNDSGQAMHMIPAQTEATV